MQTHAFSEDERQLIRTITSKLPMTAALRVEGEAVSSPEALTEAAIQALSSQETPSLLFDLRAMGVHVGEAMLARATDGEEKRSRWAIRFDAQPLDRFASGGRNRDWKHGLIGSALRAVWDAADALGLAERLPDLADLLQPDEFTAVRWDPSRDKEKDRVKDIPLVNVSATGGGATPPKRTLAKAKSR